MENLENQPFFVVSLDDLWEPFSPPLVQSAMVLWFYGKQQEDKGGWEEDTEQGWRQCHVDFLAAPGKVFVFRRNLIHYSFVVKLTILTCNLTFIIFPIKKLMSDWKNWLVIEKLISD